MVDSHISLIEMWINGSYTAHSREQHLSPMLKENLCSTAVLPWILHSEGTEQSSHLQGTDPAQGLQLHTEHHAHADFLHISPVTSAGSTPWPAQTSYRWQTVISQCVLGCNAMLSCGTYLQVSSQSMLWQSQISHKCWQSYEFVLHLIQPTNLTDTIIPRYLTLLNISASYHVCLCFGFIYLLHTNWYNMNFL